MDLGNFVRVCFCFHFWYMVKNVFERPVPIFLTLSGPAGLSSNSSNQTSAGADPEFTIDRSFDARLTSSTEWATQRPRHRKCRDDIHVRQRYVRLAPPRSPHNHNPMVQRHHSFLTPGLPSGIDPKFAARLREVGQVAGPHPEKKLSTKVPRFQAH